MKRFLALFLAGLLVATPAFAGFAPISATLTGGCIASGCVASGSVNGLANVTSSVTTVDIPIGSLVFIALSIRSNVNFTCSDSAGNTYTVVSVNNASGQGSTSCWSRTTIDLPIASTFTGTQASTTAKGILVGAFSGSAASTTLDPASPTGTTGASATPSVGPSGTWTCIGGTNCSLQIGMYTTSATLSVSSDSGFTSLGSEPSTAAGSLHFAYQIVSVTTATTYAPVNATSGNWAAQLRGFEAASTGALPVCTILTTDVGSC